MQYHLDNYITNNTFFIIFFSSINFVLFNIYMYEIAYMNFTWTI